MSKKQLYGGLLLAGVILLVAWGVLSQPGGMGEPYTGRGSDVGIIYIEGMILGGRSGGSLLGGSVVGSDDIIALIQAAREDPSIQAVVLRINSPGGSSAAAEEIGVELRRLRDSGKTVVDSLGDTAASGGYWVAALADRIVANAATTTGSIGVIVEVSNYAELYQKLGVEFSVIKSGAMKDMGSAARDLTEAERSVLQAMVDDIYEQFVAVVAAGRQMAPEAVRELADGRIFSGRQALSLGLVDEIGNFNDAIRVAAEYAGLGDSYGVTELGTVSPWERLLGSVTSLAAGQERPLLDRFLLLPDLGGSGYMK